MERKFKKGDIVQINGNNKLYMIEGVIDVSEKFSVGGEEYLINGEWYREEELTHISKIKLKAGDETILIKENLSNNNKHMTKSYTDYKVEAYFSDVKKRKKLDSVMAGLYELLNKVNRIKTDLISKSNIIDKDIRQLNDAIIDSNITKVEEIVGEYEATKDFIDNYLENRLINLVTEKEAKRTIEDKFNT